MKISNKYRRFLKTKAKVEILEGTTSAGKTTIGMVKAILYTAKQKRNVHLIVGQSIGMVEKNIINCDYGLIEVFGDYIKYNAHGKGSIRLPYLTFTHDKGEEIIYIAGYSDKSKWKDVLGSQYGVVAIDEINIAHIDFVREISMRYEYLLGTLNPDNPDLQVYEEFINHCKPIAEGTPQQIITELEKKPNKKGWIHWFFDFYDNLSLTNERIESIKCSVPKNSIQYKSKILGIRGKVEGLIYDMSLTRVVNNIDNRLICIDLSIDSGYMKSAAAFTAYGLTNKGEIIVLDTYYFKPTEFDKKAPSQYSKDLFEFRMNILKKYKCPIDTDTIDSAEGALRNQFYYDYGLKLKPVSKKKKKVMIEQAFNILSSGKVLIMNTDNNVKYWLSEHRNYAWDTRKEDEPIKENDHCPDNFQYYIQNNLKKLGLK